MRVPVNGIPAAGRQLDFGLSTEWAVEAAKIALDGPPEQLEGSVTFTPASNRGLVQVVGSATASRSAACDRCGDPCEHKVHSEIALLYAPEGRDDDDTFDGGEVELSAHDMDLGWYVGGALDLATVLGEALALDLPARIHCADDGECDKRTAALLSSAGSAGEPGHPALAALRDKFA